MVVLVSVVFRKDRIKDLNKKSRINKVPAKRREKIIFLDFCTQSPGAYESPTEAHGSHIRIPVVERKKKMVYNASVVMKLSAKVQIACFVQI